jgi:hypothetical protein
MKYPIGTKLIPHIGDGYGHIIDHTKGRYVVVWKDKIGLKVHTERAMYEIIRSLKYSVTLPTQVHFEEELFTL